jgi:hypothetical protein
MSAASAQDAAAMAKHTALTAAKILFAQIVMEKEGFDMRHDIGESLKVIAQLSGCAAVILILMAFALGAWLF